MAKKKKLQSGAASFLDDPNILDVLPQIQKPNLQSDQVGDIRALLPLLAMGVTAAAPSLLERDTEGKLREKGYVVPPEGLSDEEKKQLGLDGSPVGGGTTPLKDEEKLPTTTAGDLPEVIPSSPPPFPLPEPTKAEPVGGGTSQLTDEEKAMLFPPYLTMGDKKKESKALVKKTMMPTLDDLPDLSGDKNMAPRFNQTEDYIRSNYTGTEEKTIDQWVNELVDPQKGLTLELRDSGLAGVLLRLNSTDGDKKITSAQLLDEILNFPSQLDAFNIPGSDLNQASFKIMGNNQELFPQVLNTELNKIQNLCLHGG